MLETRLLEKKLTDLPIQPSFATQSSYPISQNQTRTSPTGTT
jgi:hypothetical protein